MVKISKIIIILIGIYSILFVGFLTLAISSDPSFEPWETAILKMALTLIISWIIILGSLMYFFRDKIKKFVVKIPMGWKKKFVLFAIFLALIEEAIAVTITNLAPLYGAEVGQAFITASANYLQVILFHSVIVFIPMFIAWSYLLSKYDFTSSQVFLLFGLVGVVAEMTINPQAAIAGFWFFVYGLMIFLPVYTLPKRNVVKPKFRHYVLSIVLPIVFAIPVAIIGSLISTALNIPSFLD